MTNGDTRPSQIHNAPPPIAVARYNALRTDSPSPTGGVHLQSSQLPRIWCLVIVVFWRACSHLANVFDHGICASCLSFGMAGWGGRQQRQKSDSSQRGSQGLAACTCVDRPATFRDPPQTVGPRRGLNAAIHARGSSTLVAVVLAKYERRRLPPSVLAQHERTLLLPALASLLAPATTPVS